MRGRARSVFGSNGREVTSPELDVDDRGGLAKVLVEGTCPECGAEELRQYPVLAVGGWFEVVKCQRCLCSASRRPWNRLGWVTLEEDAL